MSCQLLLESQLVSLLLDFRTSHVVLMRSHSLNGMSTVLVIILILWLLNIFFVCCLIPVKHLSSLHLLLSTLWNHFVSSSNILRTRKHIHLISCHLLQMHHLSRRNLVHGRRNLLRRILRVPLRMLVWAKTISMDRTRDLRSHWRAKVHTIFFFNNSHRISTLSWFLNSICWSSTYLIDLFLTLVA